MNGCIETALANLSPYKKNTTPYTMTKTLTPGRYDAVCTTAFSKILCILTKISPQQKTGISYHMVLEVEMEIQIDMNVQERYSR